MIFQVYIKDLVRSHPIQTKDSRVGPLLYAFWRAENPQGEEISQETVLDFIEFYVKCYEKLVISPEPKKKGFFVEVVPLENHLVSLVAFVREFIEKKALPASKRINRRLKKGKFSNYYTQYVGCDLEHTLRLLLWSSAWMQYSEVSITAWGCQTRPNTRMFFEASVALICAHLLSSRLRDTKWLRIQRTGTLTLRDRAHINVHDYVDFFLVQEPWPSSTFVESRLKRAESQLRKTNFSDFLQVETNECYSTQGVINEI